MYPSSKLNMHRAGELRHSRSVQSGTVLGLIIAGAVLLRVAAALYLGNSVAVLPGTHDQISYHALAQRVIDGFGFSFAEMHWPITRPGEPTAHWSFLYTLYLAAVYLVSGITPLTARLLQAVIAGIVHPWLAYRLGKRLFGADTGIWAAAIVAVYLYFIYYAGALMTETFYIIGILWCLDLALQIGQGKDGGTVQQWLLLGVALGMTLLLRQVFLLFTPFLFLWLFWQIRRQANVSLPSVLKKMALCCAMVACLILPWTARNYVVFHKFVPINTNSGYAFFWGNHPVYGTNFPGVLPDEGPSYQELIPPELWSLNEAELDSALLQRGIGFVQEDPRRYLLLSLSRVREYFKFWPSAESGLLSNIARVGSFGLLLPFVLWGMGLCILQAAKGRTEEIRYGHGLLLLVLLAVVYTGVHLLTWTLVRYRLPIETIFVLFAAHALAGLSRRKNLLST